MNFLTEEKIEEKSINEFIENDLYELKKNKDFKLFSLNDKDINGNYTDNFELISQPEYGIYYNK
jgi:hypothetical protein